MRKIINKNKRFSNYIKKELKKNFNIKNFMTKSGYFIWGTDKHSIIYFDVGEYEFGIWQHTKQVFAEHKGNIDKFRPNRTYFSKYYNNIIDIVNFVKEVLDYKGDNLMEWRSFEQEDIKEQKDEQKQFEEFYHYILHYNGVSKIKIYKDCAWESRTINVLLNEELSSYSDEEFWKWQYELEKNMPYCRNMKKINYFNKGAF